MADLDVTRALSFLGKRFNAVVCWPDCGEEPYLTNGLCVGVILNLSGAQVRRIKQQTPQERGLLWPVDVDASPA